MSYFSGIWHSSAHVRQFDYLSDGKNFESNVKLQADTRRIRDVCNSITIFIG